MVIVKRTPMILKLRSERFPILMLTGVGFALTSLLSTVVLIFPAPLQLPADLSLLNWQRIAAAGMLVVFGLFLAALDHTVTWTFDRARNCVVLRQWGILGAETMRFPLNEIAIETLISTADLDEALHRADYYVKIVSTSGQDLPLGSRKVANKAQMCYVAETIRTFL